MLFVPYFPYGYDFYEFGYYIFTGQFIQGLEYEKKIHEFNTKMVDD